LETKKGVAASEHTLQTASCVLLPKEKIKHYQRQALPEIFLDGPQCLFEIHANYALLSLHVAAM
jgi:hypothetical protein